MSTELERGLKVDRGLLFSSYSRPTEISGWSSMVSASSGKNQVLLLRGGDNKLPKLKILQRSLRRSRNLARTKGFEKSAVNNTITAVKPGNSVSLHGQRGNANISQDNNCPSPVIRKEIEEFLKYPYYPKRDISPYRIELSKAMNVSRTIDELLRFTKLPATKLVKNSQTGTGVAISPLREYKMPQKHKLLDRMI